MKNRFFLILIFFILSYNIILSEYYKIERGRELYKKSSVNKNNLNLAKEYFEKLRNTNKDTKLRQLIDIYLGSLITISAKFEFFPHKKYEYASLGLETMEKQIHTTNSIEEMFIYAVTCDKLPFFFNKQETSKLYFNKILNKISEKDINENPKMIKEIFDYFEYEDNKSKYNNDFTNKLDTLKKSYQLNID